jgi:hypothetical protein
MSVQATKTFVLIHYNASLPLRMSCAGNRDICAPVLQRGLLLHHELEVQQSGAHRHLLFRHHTWKLHPGTGGVPFQSTPLCAHPFNFSFFAFLLNLVLGKILEAPSRESGCAHPIHSSLCSFLQFSPFVATLSISTSLCSLFKVLLTGKKT